MTRFFVITGTDTGVGKTHVTCGLARALVAAGRSVCAIKPIESGVGDYLVPTSVEDGVLLAAATGQQAPRAALLRLKAPLAPPVAADREQVTIELKALLASARDYAADCELALVEGAGGLLAPLTWDANALDVARALEAQTLVVAADKLGTINHTLLTLKTLDDAGVAVAGVVLSEPAKADESTGFNARVIERVWGRDRVAMIPHYPVPEEHLDVVLGWLA